MDWIRAEICREIASKIVKETADGEPTNDGMYSSSVHGHLFCSWAVAVTNPAAAVARWISEGAPAGISEDFESLPAVGPS